MISDSPLFPPKEFEIRILAPTSDGQCRYFGCKRQGTYHFLVKNDRDEVVLSIDPICSHHLIPAFIDAFEEA